jgi:hypothetical protein
MCQLPAIFQLLIFKHLRHFSPISPKNILRS